MKKTMMAVNGKNYTFDDHGFLDPSNQWDESFAEEMAMELGIAGGLTTEHWRVVRYLRNAFLEEAVVPPIFHACADNKIRLNRMKSLFPMGYVRGACRIAGINFATFADYTLWLSYEHIPVVETPGPERKPALPCSARCGTSGPHARGGWLAAGRESLN
jgi:tRNA 2-thiouridine synthesizing protein E